MGRFSRQIEAQLVKLQLTTAWVFFFFLKTDDAWWGVKAGR
jgi:hypothetical protein